MESKLVSNEPGSSKLGDSFFVRNLWPAAEFHWKILANDRNKLVSATNLEKAGVPVRECYECTGFRLSSHFDRTPCVDEQGNRRCIPGDGKTIIFPPTPAKEIMLYSKLTHACMKCGRVFVAHCRRADPNFCSADCCGSYLKQIGKFEHLVVCRNEDCKHRVDYLDGWFAEIFSGYNILEQKYAIGNVKPRYKTSFFCSEDCAYEMATINFGRFDANDIAYNGVSVPTHMRTKYCIDVNRLCDSEGFSSDEENLDSFGTHDTTDKAGLFELGDGPIAQVTTVRQPFNRAVGTKVDVKHDVVVNTPTSINKPPVVMQLPGPNSKIMFDLAELQNGGISVGEMYRNAKTYFDNLYPELRLLFEKTPFPSHNELISLRESDPTLFGKLCRACHDYKFILLEYSIKTNMSGEKKL
jgi:hypothetical protein